MKIAIVTGASSGLGECFVHLLDKRGKLDQIWVIARRENRLLALKNACKTSVRPLCLDLSKEESLQALAKLLEEEKPQVQMLISAAGYGKIGSYQDISLEDCQGMIDLNCRAAVSVNQVVLPYMPKRSRILQICSTSAFQPFPYLGIYAATKAFLYHYSRALNVELMPRRISVTAVCPYWIKDTEFIARAKQTRDSAYIQSFPFATRERKVAKRAMLHARMRLSVSTPDPISTLHHIAAKILPYDLSMGFWALARRL